MDALEQARNFLRSEQVYNGLSGGQGSPATSVTEIALQRHREITQLTSDGEKPGTVRRGAFTYDQEVEEERLSHGQAIIHRVEPGPHEDPNYFALLAHQAASIELAFGEVNIDFSKHLLGTVHSGAINAFTSATGVEDYWVVVLNSGLVDFVYQAAKVVVQAMNPEEAPEESSYAVEVSRNLGSIRRRLMVDPGPIDRLYSTLEAYFFKGYPRATQLEVVPTAHSPVLSLLVGLAERWLIGHEYGHGIEASVYWDDQGSRPQAEEYLSDSIALVLSVLSAQRLDRVPPEFPISSAIFALACLDIRRRAMQLLLTGDEHSGPTEVGVYPTPQDRISNLIESFRALFNVRYHDASGSYELEFLRTRSDTGEPHEFTDERANSTRVFADVLEIVWTLTQDRLLNDRHQGRTLHSMWQLYFPG